MVICSNHHINNCEECMRRFGIWKRHLKSLDTQKLNYCDKCDCVCDRLSSNTRLCCNCIEHTNRKVFCMRCLNKAQKTELVEYTPNKKVFFNSKEEMIEHGIVPSNIIELYESISKLKPKTIILGEFDYSKGYRLKLEKSPTIDFDFLTLRETDNFIKIWTKKKLFNGSGKQVYTVTITKQFNSPWEFFKYLNNYETEEKAYKKFEDKKQEYESYFFFIGVISTLIYGLSNLYNLLITYNVISDNRPIYHYGLILWFGFIGCITLMISSFILEDTYVNLQNRSDKNV